MMPAGEENCLTNGLFAMASGLSASNVSEFGPSKILKSVSAGSSVAESAESSEAS